MQMMRQRTLSALFSRLRMHEFAGMIPIGLLSPPAEAQSNNSSPLLPVLAAVGDECRSVLRHGNFLELVDVDPRVGRVGTVAVKLIVVERTKVNAIEVHCRRADERSIEPSVIEGRIEVCLLERTLLPLGNLARFRSGR